MKKSIRHLSRHGRVLLVLMLVFASIVPGAVHAAAMAGSMTAGEGGHHATDHSPVDHSMMSHHQAADDHAAPAHPAQPAGHDNATDRCCPTSCSFALCSFEPEWATIFISDSFELEPLPAFVVTVVAMLERPPRA